ncbi:MAG: mechanosensitive ion channel family protein [Treponema sp.]|jgi:small-conductance mechanosensitive channel|nr:mechanosensitive ion channel family protein [Treponema sp.]
MDNEQVIEFLKKFGIAAGIVIGVIIAIIVIWQIFKAISKRIAANASGRFKHLTIKKLRVLSSDQIIKTILMVIRILKYIITAFLLFITVPIVFSIFPQTEELADTIFDHILTPLKSIGQGIVGFIPNLFTIILTLLVTKYLLKALRFFAKQIALGRLKLPGFYPDWANPTFNILRFLIYAFTLAIIFPYLPGSHSPAFQGVSVFVGVIFSLGSSTAIGNLVAGLVITYMRPFKIGDRISIQGSTGFIVEKNLMVIRLKTHKNEYITFPNLQALSASITNYNKSLDEDEEGLILYAEITYNYATPWQTIHEILIGAAHKTSGVLKSPKPFVLQTALEDNYIRYQINCYTKQIAKIPSIYSELFENIQNGFVEHGLDMTSPQYRIVLPEESRGEGPWTEYVKKGKKKPSHEETED